MKLRRECATGASGIAKMGAGGGVGFPASQLLGKLGIKENASKTSRGGQNSEFSGSAGGATLVQIPVGGGGRGKRAGGCIGGSRAMDVVGLARDLGDWCRGCSGGFTLPRQSNCDGHPGQWSESSRGG